MLPNFGRSMVVVMLLPAILLNVGCAGLLVGATAGGGAVAYVKGELQTEKQAPIDEVYPATVQALEDSKITIHEKKQDAMSAKIDGELANGKSLNIWFERESTNITKLGIRIGTFGDEKKSRFILEKINEHLAK